jgi:hypothetical protein
MPTTPAQLKLEKSEENHHGYKGWSTFTLRDKKTNVCIGIIGEVDAYYQTQYESIAQEIATRYNQFEAMKEALIKAESALFYAHTDGTDDPHTASQVKAALQTVRETLREAFPNHPHPAPL